MNELSHLDDSGGLRMVDVGAKPVTQRCAVAQAVLVAGRQVMAAVRAGGTPKGDIFAAARVGGILAAKRTGELIPLCHNLSLTHVSVDFETEEEHIRVIATAASAERTGVEMEALTAASVAALTLYDMLKALSPSMVIQEIRLLEKSGGASGDYPASDRSPAACLVAADAIRAGVITVSDRCARGAQQDSAGPAVAGLLASRLGAMVEGPRVVPDESEQIRSAIIELSRKGMDLIVTAGGTGCSSRDVTPEATRSLVEREVPGLAEAMRAASISRTSHAALQRGICGIVGSTLVINLPGSEKGAVENLSAILHVLPHAIGLLKR